MVSMGKAYIVKVTGYVGVGATEKQGQVVATFTTKTAVKEFAIRNISKFYYHIYRVTDHNGNSVDVLSSTHMFNLMKG